MPRALVLFDVDGTLLLTGGATSRCIRRAAGALFGERFQWSDVTAGRLDHETFCALASRCGIAQPRQYLQQYKAIYLNELRRELIQHRSEVTLLPGARELVRQLASRGDVLLGLLTGNFREAVEAKLAAADLEMEVFRIGAFAEDGECRSDLVHVASARAAALTGDPCPVSRVILIGDTPRDIECARQAGCRVLSVATGQYTLEQLQARTPDAAVNDLTDPRPLEDLIRAAVRG